MFWILSPQIKKLKWFSFSFCCCWYCFVWSHFAAGVHVFVSWQSMLFVSPFSGTLTALTGNTSPLNFPILPLLSLSHHRVFPSAPPTLHLLHHYNPHHLLLFLLALPISFSILSSVPPFFPRYCLPPPQPLAKVHVINQTKMRLSPPCSGEKLHLKVLYIDCL